MLDSFLKANFHAAPKWGVLISDVKDVAKAHVACIGIIMSVEED